MTDVLADLRLTVCPFLGPLIYTYNLVVDLDCCSLFQNPCSSSPCLNNGTCQAGFTSKGYRCKCLPGFPETNCRAGTCMQQFLLHIWLKPCI